VKVYNRGDIHWVDLDPVIGREQAGRRYVFIVSLADFNQRTSMPFVCPITQGGNFARSNNFAVSLTGAGLLTQGVILCHQLRAADLARRGSRYVETAPDYIIEDVLARVRSIVD